MVTGIVTVARGMPVRGARLHVVSLSGVPLRGPSRLGRTGPGGVYHVPTAGLPDRFVVVAHGGRYDGPGGAVRKVRGDLASVVRVRKGRVEVQMVTFGTTVQVALMHDRGMSARAALRATDRVMAWPSWTVLSRDDRVNTDFVAPRRLGHKLRDRGGVTPLLRTIVRGSTRPSWSMRLYTRSSPLFALHRGTEPQIRRVSNLMQHAMDPSSSRRAVRGGSLKSCGSVLANAVKDMWSPVSVLTCIGSAGYDVYKSVTSPNTQQELQDILDQLNADYTNLTAQISTLQTQLSSFVALVAKDEYATLAADANPITGQIETNLDLMQTLAADVCQPPAPSTVSTTNPMPCGPMTYSLSGLTTALDPQTSGNVTTPSSAQTLADDVFGDDAAMGLLEAGWQAVVAVAQAGQSSSLTGGVQTSLINSAMGTEQETIASTWASQVFNQAMLTANYYNEANGCVPDTSGPTPVWPQAQCSQTEEVLNNASDTGLCSNGGAPPCPQSLMYSLNQISLTQPYVLPSESVVDPSTGLIWWNSSFDSVGPMGVAYARCQGNNSITVGDDWLPEVNGTNNKIQSDCMPSYQGMPLGAPGIGSGPDCRAPGTLPNPDCTGPVLTNWRFPTAQYSFGGNGAQPGYNCSPYTGSPELGPLPKNAALGGPGIPGLLNSVAGSSGYGTPQTALAAAAPDVFTYSGSFNTSDDPFTAEPTLGPLGSWPQSDCTLMSSVSEMGDTFMYVDFSMSLDGPSNTKNIVYPQSLLSGTCSGSPNDYTTTEYDGTTYLLWNCMQGTPETTGGKGNATPVWIACPDGCQTAVGTPYPTVVASPWTGTGVMSDFLPNSLMPTMTQANSFLATLSPPRTTALAVLVAPFNVACVTYPLPTPAEQASATVTGPPLCPGTPSQPGPVTATAGPGSATLTYAASTLTSEAITMYAVQVSSNNGRSWVTWPDATSTVSGGTVTTTVTGLTPGIAYSVRVYGVASLGTPSVARQLSGTVTPAPTT